MGARILVATLTMIAGISVAIAQDHKDVIYLKELNCTDGPFSLRLPTTYQALRSIGQLREERVLKEDSLITSRRLVFDGLQLDILTFANDEPYYLVTSALVTKDGWSFSGGFRVGDSIKSVMERLGIRSAVAGDEINVGGDTDYLSLGITGGKVSRLVYECYTG